MRNDSFETNLQNFSVIMKGFGLTFPLPVLLHSPRHTSELLLGSHGCVDQVGHLMVLVLFYPDQTLLQVKPAPHRRVVRRPSTGKASHPEGLIQGSTKSVCEKTFLT